MTDEPCSDVLGELYLFLDGELDDQARVRITAHLDDCSPCLEAFDFEADLRRVIANRCRDQVPDELRQRILGAIASSRDDEGSGGDVAPV
jgi:mycothiol system anti-sigma-R factor